MSNETRTEATPDEAREPRSFFGRWFRITPGDIIRLVLICVVVGLILAAFRVDPRRLWVDFFGTVVDAWREFVDISADLVTWGLDYFILGAILVIPIWLVVHTVRAMRRRSR
ncbi:MAG: hypothetical protein CMF74_09645 [Maricaulis sp.]|jgi:Na+/H+-dicarboxylate symporter|nr:hypothetical protein [Maricaulis sp.]HAQ34769.1 hypothetical protein [Alphaproteobacteria bacterium]